MTDPKPARQPGREPAREIRAYPFELAEIRDAQNGRTGEYTIKGHAAVFNTWTDIGPFRERIAKGAFDDVLSRDPHVLHVIDHDPGRTLSSTRNKTLELRVDAKGLHMWSRVAPTSYAADLRVLMDRGDVAQSSFAFTVADDEWKERTVDGEPVIERTIVRVRELFDVTTTAMGAYPTTDSQLASRTLERARADGRLPDSHPAETTPGAAPSGEAGGDTDAPPSIGVADEERAAAQEKPAVGERATALRQQWLDEARARQRQLTKAIHER